MDVVPLTAGSPAEHLDAWAALFRQLVEEQLPELEPPDRQESVAELIDNDDHDATGLLAYDGDRAIGAIIVHLPKREDHDRADCLLFVAADARGRQVGRRLIAEITPRLRSVGRHVLRGDAEAGTAGERFAADIGARETQRVARSRLDLTAVRTDEVAKYAERRVPGYRVVTWDDQCPDDLLAEFAAARAAMNDAPIGDARRDPQAWDGSRVRVYEAMQRLRGYRGLTTAVLHEESGAIAGFTEIYSSGVRPRGVEQDDTAVVAAHRGHGLGLLIKAINLQRLIAAEPATRWIVTWNAADNRHMRAVNETLGFEPYAEELELELDLA